MTRIRPSVTRHGTTSGQWILRSCMFSDIQPSRKGGLSVAAFPRFVQNAGHGSRAPVYVRGRRPPPVTRKPGDLSHGHAPQPHVKTAAATSVLHDRSQSAADARLKHPGRQNVPEPRLPWALISILPGYKPARPASAAACRSGGGRFGNSLPRGNCGCQLQMPVTAADGSRCSRLWTVDCGSSPPRQSENHQSHLRALEACRTSAGEPDGTIFLPSGSLAPSLRQPLEGRCSQ